MARGGVTFMHELAERIAHLEGAAESMANAVERGADAATHAARAAERLSLVCQQLDTRLATIEASARRSLERRRGLLTWALRAGSAGAGALATFLLTGHL